MAETARIRCPNCGHIHEVVILERIKEVEKEEEAAEEEPRIPFKTDTTPSGGG